MMIMFKFLVLDICTPAFKWNESLSFYILYCFVNIMLESPCHKDNVNSIKDIKWLSVSLSHLSMYI